MSIHSRGIKVGSRVIFHAQWPFVQCRATVLAIEERPREYGTEDNPTEWGAVLKWDGDFIHEAGTETFCPFWNERLKLA